MNLLILVRAIHNDLRSLRLDHDQQLLLRHRRHLDDRDDAILRIDWHVVNVMCCCWTSKIDRPIGVVVVDQSRKLDALAAAVASLNNALRRC